MIQPLGKLHQPTAALAAARSGRAVQFWFEHQAYYLPGAPVQQVAGVAALVDGEVIVLLADRKLLDTDMPPGPVNAAWFQTLAQSTGSEPLLLDRPLPLSTVRIPKPWGEEIWYTGIEARGVCRVGNTPLPWYLELAGPEFAGTSSNGTEATAPLLLKILAPRPEPGYGELYFEMHEHKVEVYVVTGVDATAWPDGTGGIRYGFNQALIDEHTSLVSFKAAYLAEAKRYQSARGALDKALDLIRQKEDIDPLAVVDTATQERWKSLVDEKLVNEEVESRETLNAYSNVYQIQRGDVIRVPPFTPHSLQHGVRVVEFQTPHYERFILSFSQKVLTQNHWDTEAALDRVDYSARFDTSLTVIESRDGRTIETVADFPEFNVERITLAPGAAYSLDLDRYALVMCIDGTPSVNRSPLTAEQAVLVPVAQKSLTIEANAGGARLLVARPASKSVSNP